jgi:peptidoglycan/xylan/chitin deacetylase (PgdA/CDA1 family)
MPGRRLLWAAAGAAAGYWLPSITHPVPGLRPAFGVADRTAPGAHVGLTFDDGPHVEGTPAVLDALREAGATATFFLVGEQVQRAPGLAREVVAAGHAVGVHCHRHRNLMFLTPGQVGDDLDRAAEAIAAATGVTPSLHRAPYGILTAAGLAAARRRGWRTYLWRRWGRDWESRATPQSVASGLTGGVEAADVLLLHDADHYSTPGSWRTTVAALPQVLEGLEARGLGTVGLP